MGRGSGAVTLRIATRNRGTKDSPDSYRQQSDYIVQSARKCFEENGVQKTTLASIAREANITRELIYYYFAGKPEILQCVLDSFVQDAVDTTQLWCETWADGLSKSDDATIREAFLDAIVSIRRFVFKIDGAQRPIFGVLAESGQKERVLAHLFEGVTAAIVSSASSEAICRIFPNVRVEDRKATVTCFITAAVFLMELDSRMDDGDILRIFSNALTPRT